MARNSIWLPKFNREAEFVVSRPFPFDGIPQRPGQIFDKSLASTRKLRLLYESRLLRMNEEKAEPKVVKPRALKPVQVQVQVQVQERMEPIKVEAEVETQSSEPYFEELFPATPPGINLKHVGNGRYAIMRGALQVSKPMPKAEAEAALAQLGTS